MLQSHIENIDRAILAAKLRDSILYLQTYCTHKDAIKADQTFSSNIMHNSRPLIQDMPWSPNFQFPFKPHSRDFILATYYAIFHSVLSILIMFGLNNEKRGESVKGISEADINQSLRLKSELVTGPNTSAPMERTSIALRQIIRWPGQDRS